MKPYLGICLVLITLAAVVLFTMARCATLADRTISHVQDAFNQVFKMQPKITINQRVVLSQTAPIAELAVVSKEELVQLGFTQHMEVLSYPVPLTEKSLTAEAVFRIKAGFDLREPFRVKIENGRIVATLPHGKILSVEQIGDLTLHGEDSTLNRITDDEREKLLHDLNTSARAQAENSSLKSDAEKQATTRLEEILAHDGEKIETEWISKSP
jgi:Protein of unknown function (DUF4230)